MFMGNYRSSLVIGRGKVLIKLTSRKLLALCDVLHVPNFRWHVFAISLTRKVRVKVMFDSDEIVLTKNDAFFRKGYCNQGLFMLNVSEIMNNKASSSSSYM